MKRKKDYISKQYSNPHLDKPKVSSNGFRYLYVTIVLVLLSYIWMLFDDRFIIKEVVIQNDFYLVKSQELENSVNTYLTQNYLFVLPQKITVFLNRSKLQQVLSEQFPNVTLSVTKNIISGKVFIKVVGYDAVAMLVSGVNRYFVSADGIVLKQVDQTDSHVESKDNSLVVRSSYSELGLPTIIDESDSAALVGQLGLDRDILNFIIEFNSLLTATSGVQLSHYAIRSPFGTDVTLMSKKGWYAILTTEDLINAQLTRLLTILSKKTDSLQYIDLRFGEKVFYK